MLRASLAAVMLTGSAALADDPKALQGTWVLSAATLAGRDHADDFAGMKLTLDGKTYVIDFAENSSKGTFAIDPARSPKRIDVTSREGPFKGKTLPGIYELSGDTLRLCLDSEGKPDQRPTAFEAPAKSKAMLLTFKRAVK